MTSIRNFKLIFTIIGTTYVVMASSFLVRGTSVFRDFGVPESTISDPIVGDLFSFFYLLMAYIGVLTVLFGHVVRERSTQLLVASVFFITNILTALRDLQTSESPLGNHLYKGEATMVFVYISLTFAAAYGYLIVRGLMTANAPVANANA